MIFYFCYNVPNSFNNQNRYFWIYFDLFGQEKTVCDALYPLLTANEERTRSLGCKKVQEWLTSHTICTEDMRASPSSPTKNQAKADGNNFIDRAFMMKIWKGLDYTMWMADKQRNQQQVTTKLTSMFLHFQDLDLGMYRNLYNIAKILY